jgi:hypothetical protein
VCWLKGALPGMYYDETLTSGRAPLVEAGVDRPGSDYNGFWLPEPRRELCAAQCARESGCRAWTYVAPAPGGAAACWLKSGIPGGYANAETTSGVVDRTQEVGFDRAGSDFASMAATSPRQCASECAKNARCRTYSYVASWSWCFLKDAAPWPTPNSNVTSGVRGGLELAVDRPGGDYKSFRSVSAGVAGRDECQSSCATESACQAWTWTPPAGTDPNGFCRLKSTVPAAKVLYPPHLAEDDGRLWTTSGVKGFELGPNNPLDVRP